MISFSHLKRKLPRLFASGLVLSAAVLCTAASTAHGSNLILNGDFEDNSLTSTSSNLVNAVFNTKVANVTAFGTAEEIDVMNDSVFGSPAESGNWKLGLHTEFNGHNDAFSFTLSAPVLGGQNYTLDFYAQAVLDFDPNIGAVQVGLSNSATSFGTQIFSGTPLDSSNGWTHFSTSFTAPANAQFLTVQEDPNTTSAWNHIDNFSLTPLPEPASLILLGLGGLGLAGYARGRRCAQSDSLAGLRVLPECS